MKRLLTAMVILAAQQTLAGEVYLENTDTQSLHKVESHLTVLVSYPIIEISGVCALEIVVDSFGRAKPAKNLISVLNLKEAYGPDREKVVVVISDTVLRIPLSPSYIDGVKISTKDGSSLASAITRALGQQRRVVVKPRSC